MKKNIMNVMMLSCLKATELIELREEAPLSFIKNMQLRMHVAMCSGCRNYMKQSLLINSLLNKNFNMFYSDENTDNLEASIISKL